MKLLSLQDLADRWGVSYDAVKMRKSRGQLPEPDLTFGKSPVWSEETIAKLEATNGHTGANPDTG